MTVRRKKNPRQTELDKLIHKAYEKGIEKWFDTRYLKLTRDEGEFVEKEMKRAITKLIRDIAKSVQQVANNMVEPVVTDNMGEVYCDRDYQTLGEILSTYITLKYLRDDDVVDEPEDEIVPQKLRRLLQL